jgi:hypothetical protein
VRLASAIVRELQKDAANQFTGIRLNDKTRPAIRKAGFVWLHFSVTGADTLKSKIRALKKPDQ